MHSLHNSNSHSNSHSNSQPDELLTAQPAASAEAAANSDPIKANLIAQSLDMMDWIDSIQTQDDLEKAQKPLALKDGLVEKPTFFSRLSRNLGVTLTGKRLIEITELEVTCGSDKLFWGGNVDSLRVKDKLYNPIAPVYGWVLGRETTVTMVRLATATMGLADAPVDQPRPDVKSAYSFTTQSDKLGFNLLVNFDMLPAESMIQLQAIFADGAVVPFAFIKYQKYSGLFG